MSDALKKTPAPKWVCESSDCGKEYASKGSMKAHAKRCHKTVEEIQSPLGRFPSAANPARVLLFDEEHPSTQGNSAGQVNSPKVVSPPTFICDECEKHFDTKENVMNHKKDSHQQKDDDDVITENAVIAEELESMVRKVRLIYNQDCHECNMSEEVVKSKEELLVKKDLEIEMLERRVKKTDEKKNELEKDIKKLRNNANEHKKEMKECIDLLEKSNRKVTTLTEELATKNNMAEVTEDEDRNEHLKCDKCDFNSRNKVLFDAHITFKHGPTSINVCNACNLICSTNDELELHFVEEHQDEVNCLKCNAVFKMEQDVYDHSNSSCSEIIPLNTCDKCERDIVSKAFLKKHVKTCKGKKQTEKCRNGNTCSWLRNGRCKFFHPNQKQYQQPKQRQQQQMNKNLQQVHHFPRYQQPRQQQQQRKTHPQKMKRHQPSQQQQTEEWQTVQNRRTKDCKWGSDCFRWRNGTYRFNHNQESTMLPQTRPGLLWCQFQDKCIKNNCDFLHFQQGFPMRNLQRNQY